MSTPTSKDNVRAQLRELRSKLIAFRRENEMLRKEKECQERMSAEVEAKTATLELRMRRQNDELRNENSKLKAQLQNDNVGSFVGCVGGHNEEVEMLHARVASLSLQAAKRERQLNVSRESFDHLSRKYDALAGVHEQLRRDSAQYQCDLNVALKEVAQLQLRLDTSDRRRSGGDVEELHRLRQRCAALEHDRLRSAEQVDAERESHAREMKALQEQVDARRVDESRRAAERQRDQSGLAKWQHACQALTVELEEAKRREAMLTRENAQLRQLTVELEEAKRREAMLTRENAELRQVGGEWEAQLLKERESFELREQALRVSVSKRRQTVEAGDDEKARLLQFGAKALRLQKQNVALEAKCDERDRQISALNAQLRGATNAQRRAERLQRELDELRRQLRAGSGSSRHALSERNQKIASLKQRLGQLNKENGRRRASDGGASIARRRRSRAQLADGFNAPAL
jgi:chromosome segregation ATPase